MKSRLNRFLLISFLIHLLILVLFSYQKIETVKLEPLTVDIAFSGSSSSLNQSSSPSPNKSSQKNQTQSTRNASTRKSSTPKVKSSSSKATQPTLIRNNPKPSSIRPKFFSDSPQEFDSLNRQITLDKSKERVSGSKSLSSPNPKSGVGSSGGKSGVQGFGEKSVFDKASSANSGGKDLGLGAPSGSSRSSGRGTSASTGNSSAQRNHGFNWKESGHRTLISKNDLVFPKNLEGKGVDEVVVIAFKVTPDGKVFDIELVKSSGYSQLDNAVKDQVRSFRFNSISGKKTSEVEYSYLFKLEEKK